jgi:hypothetical protein
LRFLLQQRGTPRPYIFKAIFTIARFLFDFRFYLLASEMAALPVVGQGPHPTSSFLAAKIGKILVPCNTKYYKNACVYTFLTTPMHERSNAHELTDLSSSAPKAMLRNVKNYAPMHQKLCFRTPKALLLAHRGNRLSVQEHSF